MVPASLANHSQLIGQHRQSIPCVARTAGGRHCAPLAPSAGLFRSRPALAGQLQQHAPPGARPQPAVRAVAQHAEDKSASAVAEEKGLVRALLPGVGVVSWVPGQGRAPPCAGTCAVEHARVVVCAGVGRRCARANAMHWRRRAQPWRARWHVTSSAPWAHTQLAQQAQLAPTGSRPSHGPPPPGGALARARPRTALACRVCAPEPAPWPRLPARAHHANKQGLYSIDPQLAAHKDHLDYRWGQYQAVRSAIIKAHGSLEEFARVRAWAAVRARARACVRCGARVRVWCARVSVPGAWCGLVCRACATAAWGVCRAAARAHACTADDSPQPAPTPPTQPHALLAIAHPWQGYENLGFTRKGNATVYREWAPGAKAAALIGDFNKWEPTWMEKDEWGVWSVEIPDGEGFFWAGGGGGARCGGGGAGGGCVKVAVGARGGACSSSAPPMLQPPTSAFPVPLPAPLATPLLAPLPIPPPSGWGGCSPVPAGVGVLRV
jgi:hypothetical protein